MPLICSGVQDDLEWRQLLH